MTQEQVELVALHGLLRQRNNERNGTYDRKRNPRRSGADIHSDGVAGELAYKIAFPSSVIDLSIGARSGGFDVRTDDGCRIDIKTRRGGDGLNDLLVKCNANLTDVDAFVLASTAHFPATVELFGLIYKADVVRRERVNLGHGDNWVVPRSDPAWHRLAFDDESEVGLHFP